jgi:hypothetical protein
VPPYAALSHYGSSLRLPLLATTNGLRCGTHRQIRTTAGRCCFVARGSRLVAHVFGVFVHWRASSLGMIETTWNRRGDLALVSPTGGGSLELAVKRRSLHSGPMRCDHCRKSFGLVIHRYWRMRFCSADCWTAYQNRLGEDTKTKIRRLDFVSATNAVSQGVAPVLSNRSFVQEVRPASLLDPPAPGDRASPILFDLWPCQLSATPSGGKARTSH